MSTETIIALFVFFITRVVVCGLEPLAVIRQCFYLYWEVCKLFASGIPCSPLKNSLNSLAYMNLKTSKLTLIFCTIFSLTKLRGRASNG